MAPFTGRSLYIEIDTVYFHVKLRQDLINALSITHKADFFATWKIRSLEHWSLDSRDLAHSQGPSHLKLPNVLHPTHAFSIHLFVLSVILLVNFVSFHFTYISLCLFYPYYWWWIPEWFRNVLIMISVEQLCFVNLSFNLVELTSPFKNGSLCRLSFSTVKNMYCLLYETALKSRRSVIHVFFYKKLGSAPSTKSLLISHENFAITVLKVS